MVKKESMRYCIEKTLSDIGGFSWDQAETWASFCYAVGIDPMPYIKAIIGEACAVNCTSDKKSVPEKSNEPELWVVTKGYRTHFKVVEAS
ncbi:MAG: hypothetical protein R6V76_00470 [Desulfobacterales bacterium]